jgi:DNA-directed RNA polymerase subunit RPC12/RpoP
MGYICGDCGHEQDSMYRSCDECKSIRVVLKSIITDNVDGDWGSLCFPKHAFSKALEQPGWNE